MNLLLAQRSRRAQVLKRNSASTYTTMAKGITEQQKKIVLTAIVACIILYVDFAYVLRLQLNNLKSISGKLRQVKVSLNQYNKNSTYYKDLQEAFDRLKNKHRDIEKYVFSDTDLPLFLDDLSKRAYSFDVKIMQVKPQSGSSAKAKGADKALTSNFHPLLLEFDLACGYHQLGKFLSALEANPLVEVSQIKINSESRESTKQKVALTLKLYAQKK